MSIRQIAGCNLQLRPTIKVTISLGKMLPTAVSTTCRWHAPMLLHKNKPFVWTKSSDMSVQQLSSPRDQLAQQRSLLEQRERLHSPSVPLNCARPKWCP